MGWLDFFKKNTSTSSNTECNVCDICNNHHGMLVEIYDTVIPDANIQYLHSEIKYLCKDCISLEVICNKRVEFL